MQQLLPGIARAVEEAKRATAATRDSNKETKCGVTEEDKEQVCFWLCWTF
jgi:hypothetical protein